MKTLNIKAEINLVVKVDEEVTMQDIIEGLDANLWFMPEVNGDIEDFQFKNFEVTDSH